MNPKLLTVPAWIECRFCDEFVCTIHQQHVCDCPCPEIDDWALRGVNPYAEGGPTLDEYEQRAVDRTMHLFTKALCE